MDQCSQLILRLNCDGHDKPPIIALPMTCSAQAFLTDRPECAYTTLVTARCGTAIPLVTQHARRLLDGYEKLNETPHRSLRPPVGQLTIETALIQIVSTFQSQRIAMIRESNSTDLRSNDELQVVVVLQHDSIHAHAKSTTVPQDSVGLFERYGIKLTSISTPISTRSCNLSNNIVAEVHGQRRSQPLVKNSSWVSQRAHLEQSRPSANIAETILVDPSDGFALYEGLVTNLFVVLDVKGSNSISLEPSSSALFTAPGDTILPGTVRQCVLEACQHLNLTVIDEPPRLADWRNFQGAFVTNALRVLQPLTSLIVREPPKDGSIPKEINLPWPLNVVDFVHRIDAYVRAELTLAVP